MGKSASAITSNFSKTGERLSAGYSGKRVLIQLMARAARRGDVCGGKLAGKASLETCRRVLQAKGAALDWTALKPAPAADADNFFKASRMEDWFGDGAANELLTKLSTLGSRAGVRVRNTNALAELKVVPPDKPVQPGEADLVLTYRDFLLTLADPEKDASSVFGPGSEVIPLIIMDDVPLRDAIRSLARQANLNYLVDPSLGLETNAEQPRVFVRWENVTARQGLQALLNNYGLQIACRPPQKIALITRKELNSPPVEMDPDSRASIETLLRLALEQGGNQVPIRGLTGSQDLALLTEPIKPVKPLRVLVQTDEQLTLQDLAQVLSTNSLSCLNRKPGDFRVESSPSNSFQIFLGPPDYFTAAGYLSWSDQLRPEFDLIREALKRPRAQRADDYREPAGLPVPNYVTLRHLAQTLAQRAQCYLLLDQPDAALRELTMMHDLSRVMTRKPVTLLSSMIHVAVTGVYTSVVGEGLVLNAWRAPHLRAVEQQLEEVALLPTVVAGLQFERLWILRELENGQLPKWARFTQVSSMSSPPTPSQRMRVASCSLLNLIPNGWIYDTMAAIGEHHQGFLDAVDLERGLIRPRQIDAASNRTREVLYQHLPGTLVIGFGLPIFSRAWQTAARQQTLANQAFLACALERYRLAHGCFPNSLTALTPEFADHLPLDITNGHPLQYHLQEDGQFRLYSVGWDAADEGKPLSHSGRTYAGHPQGHWAWNSRSDW